MSPAEVAEVGHMIYLASPYSNPDADMAQQRLNRPAEPPPR